MQNYKLEKLLTLLR